MIQVGNEPAKELTPGVEYRTSDSKVDICFVFDTTGSMSDKIDGLVASTVDLVRDLATLRLDWEITTVPFGDLTVPGDRIVEDQPHVSSLDAAEAQLRSMPRFGGGGNSGESSIEAVQAALRKSYRPDAVKIFILITDEPALQTATASASLMAGQLRRAEAIVFVASPDLPYYREWAEIGGGVWVSIQQTMDTSRLRDLLRALVREVAMTAKAVHAAGSVKDYLALPGRPVRRALGSGEN